MTTTRSTAAQVEARIALAGDLLAAGNSPAETAAGLAETEGLGLRQAQRVTREAIARQRIADLPRSQPEASDWVPSTAPAAEPSPFGAMADRLATAIDRATEAEDWRAVAALSSSWARLQEAHERRQPLQRFGASAEALRAADAIADLPADYPH